jgi:hypothetical protein
MNISLFSKFLVSDDTLWVYSGDRRIFASDQRHLLPLLEYINEYASYQKQVTILDRIMGNAAALLSVEAAAKEVYSPLGSELAASTLAKHNIDYHLNEIVPYIWDRSRGDMCPLEKLSINKSPEEFYEAVRHLHAGT